MVPGEMVGKGETDNLMNSNQLELGDSDQDAPKDKLVVAIYFIFRCRIVYIMFFVIGIGTLLPWNFYITATQVILNMFYFKVFSIPTSE